AVVPLRDLSLEGRVVERMVLHVHREVLLTRLEGNALRYRPAGERPAPLEAEVVVETPRVVALDDEDRLLAALLPVAERLRSLAALPLPLVVGELPLRHGSAGLRRLLLLRPPLPPSRPGS